MSVNLQDSILFLSCARTALKELAPKDKQYVNFVMNEATDYEIMHAVIRESFPKEHKNDEDEKVLFETLQSSIDENFSILSENLDLSSLSSLVEIGQVSNVGISSSQKFLSENTELVKTKIQQSVNEGVVDDIKERIKDLSAQIRATTNPTLKNKLGLEIRKLRRQLLGLVGKAGKGATRVGKEVKSAAVHVGKEVTKGMQVGAEKGIDVLKTIGSKTGTTGIARKLGISKEYSGVAGGIGTILAASLLLYGAYKTYQRFFSKAARACKGKTGADRAACIKKFKLDSLRAQMSDLSSGSAICAKTKNPAKCKAVVAKKIAKIKAKMAKISATK